MIEMDKSQKIKELVEGNVLIDQDDSAVYFNYIQDNPFRIKYRGEESKEFPFDVRYFGDMKVKKIMSKKRI